MTKNQFIIVHNSIPQTERNYQSITQAQQKLKLFPEFLQQECEIREYVDTQRLREVLDEIFGDTKELEDCMNNPHNDSKSNYPEQNGCKNWVINTEDEYYSYCNCGSKSFLKRRLLERLSL